MVASREKDPRELAINALKHLNNEIPDWQRRLDDLTGQIDRRQVELAAVAGEQSNASSTRTLRNEGSSKSLKPKDDGAMQTHTGDAQLPVTQFKETSNGDMPLPSIPFPSSPESENRDVLPKHAQEATLAAHHRARGQTKKKRRSSSMASAEEPNTTYRTRSKIIVYYDSYVQGFFNELVLFLSTSRNLMRQAQMAAKVAHIKRMAEVEIADDGSNPVGDSSMSDGLPSLRYTSTRGFGPTSTSRHRQLPDIFKTLDKSLDFIQCTCEHGAHQFLKNANCKEDINKIQARMHELLGMSRKELQRVQRKELEPVMKPGEGNNTRARLPISVARDKQILESRLDTQPSNKLPATPAKREPVKTPATDVVGTLYADDNLCSYEAIEFLLPELQYRPTWTMRNQMH